MSPRVLIALFLLGLAGCAAPSPPQLVAAQELERSRDVRIDDLRPQSESRTEGFSLLVSSEESGIGRLGDSLTDPSGPRLLAHRAKEHFASGPAPLEVKLLHFVVYRNGQAAQRHSALVGALTGGLGLMIDASTTTNVVGGPVSSVVDEGRFEDLAKTEFKRAWYTESEAPADQRVLIVYIDSEIRGTRRFTRTVSPSKSADGKAPIQIALDAAIAYQLRQYDPKP